MIKEAFDDIARMKWDWAINNKKHPVWNKKKQAWKNVANQDLKVGQLIKIHHNERLPADLILLYTTEKQGTVFIRTDQLDGETDWKLWRAVGSVQRKNDPEAIVQLDGEVVANPPSNMIYEFEGKFINKTDDESEGLSLE